MTIRQLEYFLMASRTLSFTKTAEAYYLSQSAITQQMKSLEEELDVKLFARNNNKIALTSAGELLVQEAEAIVIRARNAAEKLHDIRDGMTGTLRIGYLQSVEMTKFPIAIQKFSEDYPGIRLELHRDNAVELHRDFMEGRYDLIFNVGNEALSYPGANQRILKEYPYYVVVRPNHPFAHRHIVTQEDLKYENLIVHESTQLLMDTSGKVSEKYLTPENMANIITTEGEVETILIMVAAGIGTAVLPQLDILIPQISLNLIHIPLETGGYNETLSVYYPEEVDNPMVPVFLKSMESQL
ncbi:MAG: LysR family transcriptional regulator [Eubacterium sp.]|nr:LysR family transcriptional regulator [Eubacterium sp.]